MTICLFVLRMELYSEIVIGMVSASMTGVWSQMGTLCLIFLFLFLHISNHFFFSLLFKNKKNRFTQNWFTFTNSNMSNSYLKAGQEMLLYAAASNGGETAGSL